MTATDLPTLTPAALRALTVLRDQCDQPMGTAQIPIGRTYPRAIALDLWPDSPGWKKRSRRGAGAGNGAMGAGMPMAAANAMWRLWKLGLAQSHGRSEWTITSKGREVLAAADAKTSPE